MSLGEVIAQTLADCAELPVGELNSVVEWLDDQALPVLSALAGETVGPELPEAVAHLVQGREAAVDAVALLESAIGRLTAYCERQGRLVDQDKAEPDRSVSDSSGGVELGPVGEWVGKSVAERVRDGGVSIGREPLHIAGKKQRSGRRRSKPGCRIREVRSVAELDDLFAVMTRGGIPVEIPTYDGTVVELPDGTRVGYRCTSATSVFPTVDVWATGDSRLKIHVNEDGWGSDVQ